MKYLKLIRITNWLKNVFVIFPLVFSLHLFQINSIKATLLAFLLFSFTGSALYILNDILDIDKDRLHPRKKNRPLPSGEIGISLALIIMTLFAISVGILNFLLPINFRIALLFYFMTNLAYNFGLKNVNLIESITLAVNFVIRVLAGCYAIAVVPSNWILVITFFIALFLTLIKRKSELKILQDNAVQHRKVLKNYTVDMLDKLIYICATITLTAYMLYTIDAKVTEIFGTDKLVFSTIFVVLGIFRFIQLSESKQYSDEGDPTTLLLKDAFSQIVFGLWVIYIVVIIYLKPIL